jgi:hypothetical protein
MDDRDEPDLYRLLEEYFRVSCATDQDLISGLWLQLNGCTRCTGHTDIWSYSGRAALAYLFLHDTAKLTPSSSPTNLGVDITWMPSDDAIAFLVVLFPISLTYVVS